MASTIHKRKRVVNLAKSHAGLLYIAELVAFPTMKDKPLVIDWWTSDEPELRKNWMPVDDGSHFRAFAHPFLGEGYGPRSAYPADGLRVRLRFE